MTIQEKAELAVQLKHSGRNCAQAVAEVLAEEAGLSPEQMRMLSAGFGGGMGNMENTCGSLVGAVIVAGMRTNGQGTIRVSKLIGERFAERSGAYICRELKGRDTGTVLCPCDDCVRNAVLAYGEILGIGKQTL